MTQPVTSLSALEEKIHQECRWEKDPSTIRSVFADLVRLHYSDQKNITSLDIKNLQKYIWNEDPALSKIHIDVAGKFDPKLVEIRPAIFVGISDLDFERTGFRNESGDGLLNGTEDSSTINSCQALFHHVGTNTDEAMALARITGAYLIAFADRLRREFCFAYYFVSKISRPAILYEARERWVSTVYLDLKYIETWQVPVESHKLKTIQLGCQVSA